MSDNLQLKDLVEYAKQHSFNVPDETVNKWKELLDSGEKAQGIRDFIDRSIREKREKKEKNDTDIFISCVRNLTEDQTIADRIGTSASKTLAEILEEYNKGNAGWREHLREKVESVLEDIQKVTYCDLSPEAQSRVGWFVDIGSDKGKELSCKMAVEDIYEHAMDKGLKLPKTAMTSMNQAIQEKSSSINNLTEFVDSVSSYHQKKGFEWWIAQTPSSTGHLMRLYDKQGGMHAYIVARKNRETNEDFYVANRIGANGKESKIGSGKSIEGLVDRVSAYYVGISINEIKELNKARMTDKNEHKEFDKDKQKGMEI